MKKITLGIPDRDERGVSPVIGVILMVAITVILAAVIASFVLGFGDSVSENVQAGADISVTDSGNATVTWISEGNAANLSISTTPALSDAGVAGVHASTTDLESVGDSATIYTNRTNAGPTRDVMITVTAYGEGGSQTVVVQEEVELTEVEDQ